MGNTKKNGLPTPQIPAWGAFADNASQKKLQFLLTLVVKIGRMKAKNKVVSKNSFRTVIVTLFFVQRGSTLNSLLFRISKNTKKILNLDFI